MNNCFHITCKQLEDPLEYMIFQTRKIYHLRSFLPSKNRDPPSPQKSMLKFDLTGLFILYIFTELYCVRHYARPCLSIAKKTKGLICA